MNKNWNVVPLLCFALIGCTVSRAETPGSDSSTSGAPVSAGANSTATTDDLNQLRERIAKQEEEIKRLQESVAEQRVLLDKALQNSPATQNGGTATAISSAAPVQLIPAVEITHPRGMVLQHPETKPGSPLAISIGNTTFAPLGFVDATFFGRSSNVGSGIGTNFGGIPYNTSATNHISEANFSTQNSRIGFRVDSNFMDANILGYFEADFLGNQPTNVFVTSNSDTFRMRNVFVDVQKNGFELLGGQDWSLATPNRKGLSPLPSDIFYTQNMDTNYQVGLVWSRQSQFRFIAHPSDNFALGVSLENPQQYIGGSGGLNGAAVTLPAAAGLSALSGTQINNGGTSYSAANLHPDIIVKAAYDGHVSDEQILHVEAAGIFRSFKDAFPFGTPTMGYHTSTATAASGELNANLGLTKNFRLIANTFFGSGNGRYVFGLAPDFILRADGTISPIHTYSTVDGFEMNLVKNTLLYAYYGGVYVDRNIAVDTTGKYIGYGFTGSSNSNNRTIQEGTLGVVQTFWKNPNYGALSLITQYSYLTRNPWFLATGAPKETHTNMYWVDLRYTLP